MRTHHPWWPHLDFEPIFNPFISLLERIRSRDPVELPDSEEDEEERRRESPEVHSRADK